MDDEGVMKIEDNSLLVLGLGVKKLPAMEASEKWTRGRREGGSVINGRRWEEFYDQISDRKVSLARSVDSGVEERQSQ